MIIRDILIQDLEKFNQIKPIPTYNDKLPQTYASFLISRLKKINKLQDEDLQSLQNQLNEWIKDGKLNVRLPNGLEFQHVLCSVLKFIKMASDINSKEAKSTHRKAHPEKNYLTNNKIPTRLIKYGIASYLNDGDTHSLARSGVNLHSVLKEDLNKRALKQLLQAVIEDDEQTVTCILKLKPHFLLIEPANLGIKEIENKRTGQRFLTEKVFIMAQKLQRPKTTNILFRHFDNVERIKMPHEAKGNEKKDGQSELLKQWIFPVDHEEQKHWSEQLKISLNRHTIFIQDHFIQLIEILASDKSIQIKELNHEEKDNQEVLILNPSKETVLALKAFRNMLLPEEAVAIDKYFDIVYLLVSACHVYVSHSNFMLKYPNDNNDLMYKTYNPKKIFYQDNYSMAVYRNCVIGFIISLLDPEIQKKLHLLMLDKPGLDIDELYYRKPKGSVVGPGFTFPCNLMNFTKERWDFWAVRIANSTAAIVEQMQQQFTNLNSECMAKAMLLPKPSNPATISRA